MQLPMRTDHDGALLAIFDMALLKQIDTAGTTGFTTTDLNNLAYGDTIKFAIIVENQGSVPVRSYQVTDYLPSGLSFVDDMAINAGWTNSGPLYIQ